MSPYKKIDPFWILLIIILVFFMLAVLLIMFKIIR